MKKAESTGAKLELKRLTVRSPADVSAPNGQPVSPANQVPGVSLTCFCPTR
ncbi:hypothetical protein LVJ94_13940 [Pendulispora rubella]|uniref:Uncharacterized protein n=1 Tax=Pendulispora rubella TaxID=2741070 RepID=A0ABZ2LBN8_9BACT